MALRLIGCLLLVCPLGVVAEPVEGRLQWLQRTELGTLVSGVVEEVTVAPGDRVAAGQPMLRLERGTFLAAVQRAKAERDFQRAALTEAGRELERTQELYDRTLLSDHDLEVAKIALARAEAGLKAAQAAVAEAEQDLRYSTVRAPFAGVVLARNAEPGQTVVTRLQSVPLITLAGTERMLARVEVPAERLEDLDIGLELPVSVAGRSYSGAVYRIGLEPAEAGGGVYPVDIAFAPPAGQRLYLGQPVTVDLP